MEVWVSFFVELGESLYRFWPLVTVIGGLLGGVVVGVVKPILAEDASFKQICDWATKPGLAARYRDLIATGLRAAEVLYGPATGLSWRGYSACLLVAFVYPLFLWHLAWCLEGPGRLAGASAFGETVQGAWRWLGLTILWLSLLALGFFFSRFSRILEFFENRSLRVTPRTELIHSLLEAPVREFIPQLAIAAAISMGGFMAFGVIVNVPGVAALAAFVAFISFYVVVAVVTAGTVGVVGAVRAVVAFVTAGAFFTVGAFGAGGAIVAVVYLTFVLIVPMANALLDHVSVQVSRWLLSDLVARRGAAWQGLMVLGHIMADVIAAGLFLVILAVLLPAVLQLANWAFDAFGWSLVEWGLYLDAARHDPFGAGLLVTGMLATTLLPTVLHLLAAGGALVLPGIGGARIEQIAEKAKPTLLDRSAFLALIGLSVLVSWAVLVVGSVALWQAAGVFLDPQAGQSLGGLLADLAEGVGRAIGGPGAPGLPTDANIP